MDYRIIRALGDNHPIPLETIEIYFQRTKTISAQEYELTDLSRNGYFPTSEITHYGVESDEGVLTVQTYFREDKLIGYVLDKTRSIKVYTKDSNLIVEGFDLKMQSEIRIRFL